MPDCSSEVATLLSCVWSCKSCCRAFTSWLSDCNSFQM